MSDKLILGMTGSREGMTSAQRERFIEVLASLSWLEFRHGDCLGADAESHDLVEARSTATQIIIHPPKSDYMRAFKKGHVILEPKDYIPRDHDIVDACGLLVGFPKGPQILRSGTWTTLRYAQKTKRPFIGYMPDGTEFTEFEPMRGQPRW